MDKLNLTNEPLIRKHAALAVIVLALVAASGLAPVLTRAQAPGGTPAPSAGTAQAWIENPTEGQTLPLAPVRLVVYATDAGGVGRIELRMNGVVLPVTAGQEQTFDPERRLLRLDQQWTPDKEGKYILEARGVSMADVYGEPDFVTFCVGTCEGIVRPTPTPSPMPPPPPSPSPTSPAVSRPGPLQVSFTADRTRLRPGECAVLLWKAEGAVASVQLNGQEVPAFAQTQVCPRGTTRYTLVVTGADGAREVRELTIEVEVIVTATPVPRATDTPIPTPTFVQPTLLPSPIPLPSEIQFWADSNLVAAGSCTMIHWHVVGVKAYWVDGQPGAGDDGSRQVCPCQTETHTLHVVKLDDSQQDFQLTVQVRGRCVTPTPTLAIRPVRPLLPRVPVLPTPTPTRRVTLY